MQYRTFGTLDWKASALGFGCMRLPIIGDDSDAIDQPEATKLLHAAIDCGLNYVDTAYGYHGQNSERFVGQALKQSYREKVRLATKLPCWLVQEAKDFDRLLNEQLQKLQTDHIDFYLLHALNADSWQRMQAFGVLEWAEKAMASGRFQHLGFSFHDQYPVFQKIVDGYDKWTFCQIQYNYMDIANQAGTRGLRYAASKGLAVVIMEPLLGGRLAKQPPAIRRIWDGASQRRSSADWALQWLWSQPEVSVVLSGMSTLDQVRENIASAEQSAVQLLSSEAELALFDQVRSTYQEFVPIPCTKCRYCMPCPNGVDIPRNFEVYNEGVMYDSIESSRFWYPMLEKAQAGECMQCLACEQVCPQQIPISGWLSHIHTVLGEGKAIADTPRP